MSKSNGVILPKTIVCQDCAKRVKIKKMAKQTGRKYGVKSRCLKCWSLYLKKYRTSPKGLIASRATTKKWVDKQKELN